uniref:DUF21 domain-containing protein n=1 Tax=Rhabditophanes sp. KR3021 TaxID=114890 RepID=A0AC35UI16_9BILA
MFSKITNLFKKGVKSPSLDQASDKTNISMKVIPMIDIGKVLTGTEMCKQSKKFILFCPWMKMEIPAIVVEEVLDTEGNTEIKNTIANAVIAIIFELLSFLVVFHASLILFDDKDTKLRYLFRLCLD